jgi:hypothetical protein
MEYSDVPHVMNHDKLKCNMNVLDRTPSGSVINNSSWKPWEMSPCRKFFDVKRTDVTPGAISLSEEKEEDKWSVQSKKEKMPRRGRRDKDEDSNHAEKPGEGGDSPKLLGGSAKQLLNQSEKQDPAPMSRCAVWAQGRISLW